MSSVLKKSFISIISLRLWLVTLALFCGGIAASPPAVGQIEFHPPQKLTDGSENFRLSRIANNQIQFDSSGKLHVVYWSGESGTSPDSPSFIYYRNWRLGLGWSDPVQIAESVGDEGFIGGRHPSLTITPDNTVWVVWHDHRHTSSGPPNNNIDNIEIYADFMPAGDDFTSGDLRLTTSNAAGAGDNGYLPKIASDNQGRLSVAWYDFHFEQIGDIFLKTSDVNGDFDLTETMAEMRLTDFNDRGGADEDASFSAADLAVDSNGTRHLVWTQGFLSNQDLYYGAVPVGSQSVNATVLAGSVTGFFTPAHIEVAENDSVWIVNRDQSSTNHDIVLYRKRNGAAEFDPPMTVLSSMSNQAAPDHEIDAEGRVHLVWIDERSGRHVFYGLYNPETDALLQETQLTEESDAWSKPTIELNARGEPFILFSTEPISENGDIWFVRVFLEAEKATGIEADWTRYR